MTESCLIILSQRERNRKLNDNNANIDKCDEIWTGTWTYAHIQNMQQSKCNGRRIENQDKVEFPVGYI